MTGGPSRKDASVVIRDSRGKFLIPGLWDMYQMVPGNPDDTRGVVRGLKEAGVDFIKVHRRMERDLTSPRSTRRRNKVCPWSDTFR